MGTQQQHQAKAVRNQEFLDGIQGLGFPDWTATVIFYKAVHIAEMMLAADGEHTKSHWQRRKKIREKYPASHVDYSLLDNYSRWARYGFKRIDAARDIPPLTAALQRIEAAADAHIANP